MTDGPLPVLSAADAYRLWAATYEEENPVTMLDRSAVGLLTPPLGGKALLDAACGTAWRLGFDGAAPDRVAGVDLVFEMLRTGRRDVSRPRTTAAGDLRALPVRPVAFDVVWCRLAAGYLRDLSTLYREIARALAPRGQAVVTDFHPEASRAGLSRDFHDPLGRRCLIENVPHPPEAHERAALEAGLLPEARLDLAVTDEVRPLFERAGALDRYEQLKGIPLLLAFRFRRPALRADA